MPTQGGQSFEVVSIAYDQVNNKVATGSRDGSIQIWTWEISGHMKFMFQANIAPTIPGALAFEDAPARHMYAFGLYNGQWLVFETL